jgi:hypothetical protein
MPQLDSPIGADYLFSLVGSQFCVKMQLLIASHNQYLSAIPELHCGVRTEATQGNINVIINRFQSLYSKSALGKSSAQKVGRRSG